MHKLWPTSRRMDQARCGPVILRSCLHSAFIWLQVAVPVAVCFFNNFSKQHVTVQRKLPHFHQVIQSLARYQELKKALKMRPLAESEAFCNILQIHHSGLPSDYL